MGSALLNTLEDQVVADVAGETGRLRTAEPRQAHSPSADALRQQVAERLAAHRKRRAGVHSQSNLDLGLEAAPSATQRGARSARIAAAVAERYAQTQSYRAFLAAEAERAIQQAHAAAEVAALNAQAVAAAQQRLLDDFDEAAIREEARVELPVTEQTTRADIAEELQSEFQRTTGVEQNLWPDLDPPHAPQHKPQHRARPQAHAAATRTPAAEPSSGLTVRLYEDAASAAHVYLGASQRIAAAHANRYEERNDAEAMALDEEIAFRQAPVFEEPAGPPTPLPANLIEFPRQLVASRKARPRYAEGPLRAEAEDPAPGDGQLRIFEVDPAQISTKPVVDEAADAAATPQWTSIWLDTPSGAAPRIPAGSQELEGEENAAETQRPSARLLQAASVGRRAAAGAIDAAIVLTGVLAFAAASVALADRTIVWHAGALGVAAQMLQWLTSQGLPLNWIAGAGAVTAIVFWFLYQALFFSFNVATPAMRCVRIGLCTFDDENPTQRAMRRRILATLLSACPMALGFLWIALDEDRLAWHDRMSRMYQRSY